MRKDPIGDKKNVSPEMLLHLAQTLAPFSGCLMSPIKRTQRVSSLGSRPPTLSTKPCPPAPRQLDAPRLGQPRDRDFFLESLDLVIRDARHVRLSFFRLSV
jgi:hypothetical protein